MPTDFTLVLRNSANCAETAFASGGSDGRSARVGDRALASSSKAWRGKKFAKRGSNSPTKTPFTTKAALKIHDAPITAYLIRHADTDPHWTKDQGFTFQSSKFIEKLLFREVLLCKHQVRFFSVAKAISATHGMEVATKMSHWRRRV